MQARGKTEPQGVQSELVRGRKWDTRGGAKADWAPEEGGHLHNEDYVWPKATGEWYRPRKYHTSQPGSASHSPEVKSEEEGPRNNHAHRL